MKFLTLFAVLFLITAALSAAHAQPGIAPATPDAIGLYTDYGCSANDITGVSGVFSVYAVLTQMSQPFLEGFEFYISPGSSPDFIVTGTYIEFPGSINIGAGTEFVVGAGGPYPPGVDGSLPLVRVDYLVLNANPTYLYLEPIVSFSPSIPGSMAYVTNGSSTLIPMVPSSGDHGAPVFGFNTGPIPLAGGDITVDANPDFLGATWTLTGPGGFILNGSGDEYLANLAYGYYTLTWSDIPDWLTPSPNPVDIYLDFYDPSAFIQGTYQPLTGEIIVDGNPDSISPAWELDGPDGYLLQGAGDQVVTGLAPGEYSLLWIPDAEWEVPELNPVPVILTAGGSEIVLGDYRPLPRILVVEDVPNDQGRQVRVTWSRAPYDNPAYPTVITEYGVYRQQPAKSGEKLAGWDFVGSAPARTDGIYQMVVATLCDSTISGGWCPSTFMVSAMTADPGTFFDSLPGTGYSVDNLRPVTPSGFSVAFGASANILTWDAPTDPDVDHYLVYRTTGAPPLPGDPVLAQVEGTTFEDSGGWDRTYWLVAVDHAGNRSDFTDWGDAEVSGVADGLPRVVALHGAAPNPFNPSTKISFDLPRDQHVRLAIYAIDGRRVKMLVDELQAAGTNHVTWRGTDEAGRRVASGTYIYRMETGDFAESRRIMLVK